MMTTRDRRRALAWALAAAALHVAIAGALSSRGFFRLNVATSQRLFGGSIGGLAVFDDVRLYYDDSGAILEWRVPYRDFPVEYPPLALPFFVAPRLVASNPGDYIQAFGAVMLAVNAALVAMVALRVSAREGPRAVPRRLGWYSLAFASLGPLTVARFDLAPTALAFAAVLAWGAGRPAAAGTLAGLGTLVKLYPGVVAVPGLAAKGRRSRALAALLATLAAGVGAWVAVGGAGVAASLGYHTGRGLEIESLYSGPLIVVAKLAGLPLRRAFNHSSEELVAPGSQLAAALAVPLQLAALGMVAWRARTATHPDLLRLGGAAVVGFVLFGKVLSPQYLIWPLPFVAALGGPAGRRARPLHLAAAALTLAIFPWSFMGLIAFQTLPVALLNLRNALLLALWLVLLLTPDPTKEFGEGAGDTPAGRVDSGG